jgi:hypothetical protein
MPQGVPRRMKIPLSLTLALGGARKGGVAILVFRTRKVPFSREGGNILVFISGIILGSCFGIFIIALLAKSKEADETVSRILIEQEVGASQNCRPAGHHSVRVG